MKTSTTSGVGQTRVGLVGREMPSAAPTAPAPRAPAFTPTAELRLRAPTSLDARSDEEIVDSLRDFAPVTSERNVWAYWHSGLGQCRGYVRRFVVGWVRRLGAEWRVRVLDSVAGSATHVCNYLDSSHFPAAFNRGAMSGPFAAVHSSDLVRLPLLYVHGGVWMDVGTMLFRHVDDICWAAICDPHSRYEIGGFAAGPALGGLDLLMNGFIAARRGNPFLLRWHRVFVELWSGGRTDADGIRNHPLVRDVPRFDLPEQELVMLGLGVSNDRLNDYTAHFLAFKRVRMLQDPEDGFDGPTYWEKHAYLLDIRETMAMPRLTGAAGHKAFQLLDLQREGGDPESPLYKEAESLVHYFLANACNMKLPHGLPGPRLVYLASLWDRPENEGADIRPGTFAAFLSWGSVHCEQTRTLEPFKLQCSGAVIRAGLLELPRELPP